MFSLSKSFLSHKDPVACVCTEIVDALKAHYKSKVTLFYERFKFYSRTQKPRESISHFVAGLKALAHACDFLTQLNVLHDRLVMSLVMTALNSVFLSEAYLTFTKVVYISSAHEVSLWKVQAMSGASPHHMCRHGQA